MLLISVQFDMVGSLCKKRVQVTDQARGQIPWAWSHGSAFSRGSTAPGSSALHESGLWVGQGGTQLSCAQQLRLLGCRPAGAQWLFTAAKKTEANPSCNYCGTVTHLTADVACPPYVHLHTVLVTAEGLQNRILRSLTSATSVVIGDLLALLL